MVERGQEKRFHGCCSDCLTENKTWGIVCLGFLISSCSLFGKANKGPSAACRRPDGAGNRPGKQHTGGGRYITKAGSGIGTHLDKDTAEQQVVIQEILCFYKSGCFDSPPQKTKVDWAKTLICSA